jgi:hypothetical protein
MVEIEQKRYADDITLQELVRLRVEIERLREALLKAMWNDDDWYGNAVAVLPMSVLQQREMSDG